MTNSNNRPTSAASFMCNKLFGAGSIEHKRAEALAILGKVLHMTGGKHVLRGLEENLPKGRRGVMYGKLVKHMLNELGSKKGREAFLQRAHDVLASCAKYEDADGTPGVGALASQGTEVFFNLFPDNRPTEEDEYEVPSNF